MLDIRRSTRCLAVLGIFIVSASSCAKNNSTLALAPKTIEPSIVQKPHKLAACDHLVLESTMVLDYCIMPSESPLPTDSVIYYFHGLFGSADEINSKFWRANIDEMYRMFPAKMPHLVSLSFGPAAIITPHSMNDTAPTPEQLHDALAVIEAKLEFKDKHPRRHLLGVSLGGFNALELFNEDQDAYESVALLCPALIDFNPFEKTEIDAFIKRNKKYLDMDKVNNAIALVHYVFGNSENWLKAAPLQYLKGVNKSTHRFFASVGRQDDYGFFEGTANFVYKSGKLGLAMNWQPLNGKHCSANIHSLNNFYRDNL